MSEVGELSKQASLCCLCCLCCGADMQAEDGYKLEVRRACTTSSTKHCLLQGCPAPLGQGQAQAAQAEQEHSQAQHNKLCLGQGAAVVHNCATKRLCSAASTNYLAADRSH